MELPKSVNLFGTKYSIEYCDKPSDVDLYKRESLWGQIDYWTRTIRIYKAKDSNIADVWKSLLHEITHGFCEQLKIENMSGDNVDEKSLDFIALGIFDFITRNGFLKVDG